MNIQLTRRSGTLLAAALVGAAALVPVTVQAASAAPAPAPACYDFAGASGILDPAAVSPDGQVISGRLTFTASLAAPSCEGAVYEVSFQNRDGSVIESVRRTGTGGLQNQLTFTVDVPASAAGCVGVEGTSFTAKGSVVDEAPDNSRRSATPAMFFGDENCNSGGQFWG
jgi:hypothetical protein